MGQLALIAAIVLPVLGVAVWIIVNMRKGAKLDVINEVNEDIVDTQHEQLKAANEKHGSLEDLAKSEERI